MIGHEAVRKNCKPLVACSAQDLHEDQFDDRCIEESLRFRIAAEGQEISVQTRVVERPKVTGSMGRHVRVTATSDPRPAKAGRYEFGPDATRNPCHAIIG